MITSSAAGQVAQPRGKPSQADQADEEAGTACPGRQLHIDDRWRLSLPAGRLSARGAGLPLRATMMVVVYTSKTTGAVAATGKYHMGKNRDPVGRLVGARCETDTARS